MEMRIKIMAFVFLIFISNQALSDALKESEIDGFLNGVMKDAVSNDYDSLIDRVSMYLRVSNDTINNFKTKAKEKNVKDFSFTGPSLSYELISKKKKGSYLKSYKFIEYRKNSPVYWEFNFYRSKKGWVVYSFLWNSTLEKFIGEM